VALILSLVPGWGHVYWGREFLGLSLFTVAAVLGFAFLNGLFIYQGPGRGLLVWSSGLLLGVCEVVVWVELFVRTLPARQRREEEERERLIAEGSIAYLRNDYERAVDLFRQCLRINPQDVDAMFRLGVVHARAGDGRQARRWLNSTLRHDVEERWSWEVGRELEQLRRARGRGRIGKGEKEESREGQTEETEETEDTEDTEDTEENGTKAAPEEKEEDTERTPG
jgi:tetratricopeptide (TPR) repeat protein